MRPALNPRKFRRQGGRSPLEPQTKMCNIRFLRHRAGRCTHYFSRALQPLHSVAVATVTFPMHALQPLHSLAVAFSRGGWVFLPLARIGTLRSWLRSNCQCQWAPLCCCCCMELLPYLSILTVHTGQISWRHSFTAERSAVRRWMC